MRFFTNRLLTERLLMHQNIFLSWNKLTGHIFDKLRKSSILVPLFIRNGEVFVLLTKRSDHLRDEGGLVSFPGGSKDETDKDEIETSLRESMEEIGLKADNVDIVCQFLPWINKRKKTDILVTPVVGILSTSFKPNVNKDEVQFTFCLPLKRFLSNVGHSGIMYEFKGARLCINFFTDSIDGRAVTTWGLTAGVCIHVAICVFQELPAYQWAAGVPRPQLHDPFMDQKSFLDDLQETYLREKSKL